MDLELFGAALIFIGGVWLIVDRLEAINRNIIALHAHFHGKELK